MKLLLNVYTDDTLIELKRTVEADRLKIPYRVAITVAESLDGVNLDNVDDVIKLISGNAGYVDKIIKATFKVTDLELECVDVAELGAVAMEIYKWTIDKFKSLNGGQEKN